MCRVTTSRRPWGEHPWGTQSSAPCWRPSAKFSHWNRTLQVCDYPEMGGNITLGDCVRRFASARMCERNFVARWSAIQRHRGLIQMSHQEWQAP